MEIIYGDPKNQDKPAVVASSSRGSIFLIQKGEGGELKHQHLFQDEEFRSIQDMKLCSYDEANALYFLVAALGEGYLLTAVINFQGIIVKEIRKASDIKILNVFILDLYYDEEHNGNGRNVVRLITADGRSKI